MQLEDYFEFEKFPDRDYIRIKGTRVVIEVLLEEFLKGKTPEELHASFPTVSREQVYAAITYYLHNQNEMDRYLNRSREEAAEAYQEWARTHIPSALEKKLQALRAASNEGKQPAS